MTIARSFRSALSVVVALCASHLTTDSGQAQSTLYFTEYQFENPKIKSIELPFGPPTIVASPTPAQWLLIGIDIDARNGDLYSTFSQFGSGGVLRASIATGEITELVAFQTFPLGIALDLAGGKMYWGENFDEQLRRANLDGSEVETIYAGLQTFKPLVDSVNGYVYFAGGEAIRRMSLDDPRQVETVITGVSSVWAVALDVTNNHIYWVDQQTTADHVARANLDDTGWTVLVDLSPAQVMSSALNDLRLDLAHGDMYFCDDLRRQIWRASLSGDGAFPIYNSPPDFAPSGLVLDVQLPQPMMDCNNNGVRDRDDVASKSSADCNGNGIPDECERDPCVPIEYQVDQGVNVVPAARSLGDIDSGSGWEILQPFDVPAAGWEIGGLELHGYTVSYAPEGFTATVFPDDGTGTFPNEAAPLASVVSVFRVGAIWVASDLAVTLPAGRHWIRLRASDTYQAAVNVGTSGLQSVSRSPSGTLFPNSPPIALRLRPTTGSAVPSDLDGDGAVGAADLAILLGAWGLCPPRSSCVADLDGDGAVGPSDLALLLGFWTTG